MQCGKLYGTAKSYHPKSKKERIPYCRQFFDYIYCLFNNKSTPCISDLAIAIVTYTISWYIVSYSVKRFGPGGKDRSSLQKELIWFGVILTAFLGLLTLVSQEDSGLRNSNSRFLNHLDYSELCY